MNLDRDLLVRRLESDLVGPLAKDEVLEDARPSDVYLTGILWPRDARMTGEEAETLDTAGSVGSGAGEEVAGAAEEVPLVGLQRPCTAGVSFAVAARGDVAMISVWVGFALYQLEAPPRRAGSTRARSADTGPEASPSASDRARPLWRRRPFSIPLKNLAVEDGTSRRVPVVADGLPGGISVHLRAVRAGEAMLVTTTVINEMSPSEGTGRNSLEQVTMFQVELVVRPTMDARLVSRPQVERDGDEEERAAALLYRDCRTFAVGHTCSARWEEEPGGTGALAVATSWLPRGEVPRVSARGHAVFDTLRSETELRALDASWLASAGPGDLRTGLMLVTSAYREWIQLQRERIATLPAPLQLQASRHLDTCDEVEARMRRGIERIVADEALRTSFQLSNRAMNLQHQWNPDRSGSGSLEWRPFQLAFVLMTAASVCDDTDGDREIMDLLWFPTGGGKTEAYLGLVAMLAFHRRLSLPEPGTRSGVAAVMRYTLRLLTTQQFVRAAALILACDLIRRGEPGRDHLVARLGPRPFSIGLWLGGEATPNSFDDALMALRGNREKPSPEQLSECPCCHRRLQWSADEQARRIEVRCLSDTCPVGAGGRSALPVWTVDEDVYRERPTLLIGTIDKFAQLPRRKQVRELLAMGTVDSPDLIIQDELHLISGPLGTIAAVYEVALDWLISKGGRRAKIIGSTATIRRAPAQTRALFDRRAMQFPPSGIDHGDSGFAITDVHTPGRLYVGVTTAGRSAKFTLQAVAGCLLQAASGEIPDVRRRDPYATLVAYFNSLRELGGALVLMQDDVVDALKLYSRRHGEPLRSLANIEELTSRRTQEEVRDMLMKLSTRADQEGCVDAVLATNMVSVGVDVPRLGLMLVNGQPKTRSEYIQATSRVGRDRAPGLIVVLQNGAKPRDRSHYETFPVWHQSLYRDVEATSVTPFASRARDRALHAALVAMIRHGVPAMRDTPARLRESRDACDGIIEEIVRRAAAIDPGEPSVRRELERRLADWEAREPQRYWDDRQTRSSLLQSAERAAAQRAMGRSVGDAWPTMNNMRSVEPGVRFRLVERLRSRDDEPGPEGTAQGAADGR